MWIAGTDFAAGQNGANPTANPNAGVAQWSYGTRSLVADSNFILLTASEHVTNAGATGLNGFSRGNGPEVLVNVSNGPVHINYPAGATTDIASLEMKLHPASNGDLAIVRWTAPTAGQFSITSATWRDVDPNGGNGIDVHIVLNGVSLLDQNIGNGGSFSLSSPLALTLAAGDGLDFIVGTLGDWSYDSTAFNATIVAVPEPGTLALLLSGIGFVALGRRRDQRKS